MSKKMDKEELKTPDAFITTSDRVFSWAEKNAKAITLVVVAVLVAAGGYGVYAFIQTSREAKAAEALYRPEAELKKVEAAAREERGNQLKDLMKKDGKGKAESAARTPDFKTDYAPKVDQVVEELRRHAGTKAAMVSAMNLSYFLLQQKQYAQAREVLEVVKFKPRSGDLLNGFWQMHRGLTWLENKDYDQALQAYQAVAGAKDLSYFHPEALLKAGFTYEMKGDAAKARETYEKVGRDFPRTDAASTAQQYLRLMEMKSQKS